jgi:MazG family protein
MCPARGQVKERAPLDGRRYTFEDLVEIMDRLRSPDGCPWDREQDYATLRSYLLEECYEVVEAIDGEDYASLREELGDLLFQIVFLARLGKERQRFTASDVVQGIAEKMVRRHPHVFGTVRADTSEEVLRNWEEIKREEKATGEDTGAKSVLRGIPTGLPALLKAQRLGTKASRVGFDWKRADDVLTKLDEELAELREVLSSGAPRARVREELGDVLFTLVNLARHADVDPEAALEGANRKFRTRFESMERRMSQRRAAFEEMSAEDLEILWDEAKKG